MGFFDILRLALRNLREAKLRATLTTMGVIVGVAVIVTMVSFGLGLQRNTVERFRELDLFNEITVYGRSLSILAASDPAGGDSGKNANKNSREEAERQNDRGREKSSDRPLDDASLAEIAGMPGVAYVEPNVNFTSYVRANGRTRRQLVGGARVPNSASRFQKFEAGAMIGAPDADEAVVDEAFLKTFGYENASAAVGQTLELLAPSEDAAGETKPANGGAEREGGLSFFGLPLGEAEDSESDEPGSSGDDAGLVAQRFRITGVLKNEVEGGGRNRTRFRGLMPAANVYVPLGAALRRASTHRDALDEVALLLARQSGALGAGEGLGYGSATIRVNDPVVVKDLTKRLSDSGFRTFSLFTELDQIRTFFLVVNAALGLLGGISLLVASLGIANTMIMSILERTREIGIMKAIGAEDREIKLIFFVEAAVIGLVGGVVGALAAWGIDKVANRLVYEFVLQPRGESFINFFSLPPYLWLGAIVFAMIVAVIAALYPAARAARIDPVRALRHD